jgi:hypothetical protein
MVSTELVKKSVYFSLVIQILTTIIQISALFLVLPKRDEILYDVLTLETMVQIIEVVFYSWLAYGLYKLKDVTSTRYYDWVLTTPTMLLSTIIYFKYLENKQFTFTDFIINNKNNILKIFGFNWLMLFFGYIGETNKLALSLSIPIGFIFFTLVFYTIYSNYVTTDSALYLFNLLFVIWSLYGFAAMLSTNAKNFMYNLLDIVSKNFYGLFIFWKILQKSV